MFSLFRSGRFPPIQNAPSSKPSQGNSDKDDFWSLWLEVSPLYLCIYIYNIYIYRERESFFWSITVLFFVWNHYDYRKWPAIFFHLFLLRSANYIPRYETKKQTAARCRPEKKRPLWQHCSLNSRPWKHWRCNKNPKAWRNKNFIHSFRRWSLWPD